MAVRLPFPMPRTLIESAAGTLTDVVIEHVVVFIGTEQVRAVAVEVVPAMR
jgi:hypothetical protein